MSNRLLESALKYLDRGFSVIPVKLDKKPFIPWQEYQKRKPTPEEMGEWWGKCPSANIGIVTGAISGVSVIDIDEPRGHEEIEKYISDSVSIPTAKTPRGGQHLYFKTPSPSISNNTRIIPGCDFRGQGGFIIAPPSVNGQGKGYEWLPGRSIFEVDPPALPESYILLINKYASSSKRACHAFVTLLSRFLLKGEGMRIYFTLPTALPKSEPLKKTSSKPL